MVSGLSKISRSRVYEAQDAGKILVISITNISNKSIYKIPDDAIDIIVKNISMTHTFKYGLK